MHTHGRLLPAACRANLRSGAWWKDEEGWRILSGGIDLDPGRLEHIAPHLSKRMKKDRHSCRNLTVFGFGYILQTPSRSNQGAAEKLASPLVCFVVGGEPRPALPAGAFREVTR
jgi:hypothetical protein